MQISHYMLHLYFWFTKTTSQLLLPTCYFLQEKVIQKKKNVTNAILYPKPTESETLGRDPGNQKSWMLTKHMGWCLERSRHYLEATSCYLCMRVWVLFMWVHVYMHICGSEKSNLDALPQELSTFCLETRYLIDLGSPFRLLVDEQTLGILLSMSLGLQTHAAP